ncbi:MAG: SUMF1/EgtB/PvdO family nonheme iron enzyme [Deltaproteobacteria bacterium]|nr:SUMF1/EgtB/PvdO family nonheme iron enzyme [Deltaproteobacteria bacterium]
MRAPSHRSRADHLRATRALVTSFGLTVVAGGLPHCAGETVARGEVLVVVDTDVDVPRLVSTLRLDVWREGRWIDSRETPVRDARRLPMSFGAFSSAEDRPSRAILRLRAYGDGAVVDAPAEPRLVVDGADRTPRREPDPALAIDELVSVTVVPGEKRRVRIVLFGACAGSAADVVAGETCLAPDGQRGAVPEAVDDRETSSSLGATLAGTFGKGGRAPSDAPRPASPPDDGGEAWIPGGAFVLGSRDLAANRAWGGVDVKSTPPRVVVVSSLWMDRFEVSVGRFRRALARGFRPPTSPQGNDAALPSKLEGAGDLERFCTFSASDRSRDAYPLTCVTFDTARAFCAFEGGDLPTEAEWEYAATAALRPVKTPYPWGEGSPGCAGATFAHTSLPDLERSECSREGAPVGPSAVGVSARDVTPVDGDAGGVRDLGGNVAEWTREVYRDYDAPCWRAATQRDPTCVDDGEARRVTRGGAFTEELAGAHGALRKPALASLPFAGIGFRCVRRRGPS